MNLKSLPKVELHCHLEGILDPDMARIIQAEDSTFPLDVDAFAQIYPIQGYDAFNDWFKFCSPIFGQRRFFLPVIARHIAHLKAQNVRYTEIMLGRITLGRESILESYQAFRTWLNQHETEHFQIELLVMLGRNQPPESLAASAPTILALHEAGLIVGVALAGPKKGHPIKPFQQTLARFHEAGLGIEIHAGEWAGPESVWDALNYGYPDRIGHGIHLFQDSQLIGLFQERQIHIEFCPTSNVRTASISRLEEHPINRARELGLNFSVNTDDPGVFACSMTSEYELLTDQFGFEESDWRNIYANSLAARFQSKLHSGTNSDRW